MAQIAKPDGFNPIYMASRDQVELQLFEGEAQGFIARNPSSPAAGPAIERIIAFVHEQAR